MGLNLEPKDGDTLLSPEDLEMLIPSHVTNRKQLDEVEQNNIEDAIQWILNQKTIDPVVLFSADFQNQLHKKMLGNVWKWAGQQRRHEANVGVEPIYIATERKKLNDDMLYCFEHNSWPPKELAIRFHHRLVKIHCYPNGNGRHARIMADLIMEKLYKQKNLEWLSNDLVTVSENRAKYIAALREADRNNYASLLACCK